MDWKAIILGSLKFDPIFLILVIVAGLLLLVQFILAIRNLRKSAGAGPAGWSIVLAAVTPLLVMFVMVLDVQFSHIAPLRGVATPPAPGEFLVFLTSAMGEVIISRAVCGLVLLSAALIGIFGVVSARKTSAPTGKIVALGVCLAAAAAAAGVLMHTINLGYGLGQFSYPDNAERSIYLKQLLEEIPGYTLPLILAFVILFATACFGFIKSASKGGGTPALVASGLAFLIGAGAFMATRAHRDDVKKLPELFEKLRTRAEILFEQRDVRLPQLKNVTDLEPAPVCVITSTTVVIEGNSVMAVRDAGAGDGQIIPDMQEHLENLKKNYAMLHPGKTMPGKIILQADRETPGIVLLKVFTTCRQSGYPHFHLATLQPEIFQTSVLGELRPVRYMGLEFTVTDKEGLAFDQKETFDQLARRLDQAAGKGDVAPLVPYLLIHQ